MGYNKCFRIDVPEEWDIYHHFMIFGCDFNKCPFKICDYTAKASTELKIQEFDIIYLGN